MSDKYSNLSDLLMAPPAQWPKEQVIGYWNWSYAVVNQMCGINSRFDQLFRELFQNANVNGENLEQKLNDYYKVIELLD